jgi:hypothetical protein
METVIYDICLNTINLLSIRMKLKLSIAMSLKFSKILSLSFMHFWSVSINYICKKYTKFT